MMTREEFLTKYGDDPIGFGCDVLDLKREWVWPKMREVMESVCNNDRTVVKAGHAVSKTYSAARVALWFLLCHPPATVVTTAPTANQVRDILWREIGSAYGSAQVALGGELSGTKLNLGPKWFATGFSTRPDTVTQQATAFQGYHNDNVLVIFDEAAGILPQIWDAAEGLLTDGHTRFLAIGNPTSAYGNFAKCFKAGNNYHQITISVKDTPNFKQGRQVIPGLAGQEYENTIRINFGEDSNFYRARVLGEIPEVVEGAVYGREMICARRERRIGSVPWQQAALVHTAWDLGIGDATAIWFFQVVGQEVHIIDYHEEISQGFAHYAKVLDDKRIEGGWIYGRHFAPHDIEARELGTGDTRRQTADKLGIRFEVIPRTAIEDGIECVRQVLPRAWFDEQRCEIGLKCMCEYKWRKIERLSAEEKPVYAIQPEHDWASHGADAFRTGAQALAMGKVGPTGIDGSGNDFAEWQRHYTAKAC